MTKFNVNDQVRVQLKPWARDRIVEARKESGCPEKYCRVQEDEGGWSSWPLWALMQEVGPMISMGNEPPFATEIEFDLKRSATG